MKKYETVGGTVTFGETYTKLLDLLREAEDCCYILAHLRNTEGGARSQLLATGWRGCGQLMARLRTQITKMAMNKLQ